MCTQQESECLSFTEGSGGLTGEEHLDFGGTMLNVEINGDGQDANGESERGQQVMWNLLCDRAEEPEQDHASDEEGTERCLVHFLSIYT